MNVAHIFVKSGFSKFRYGFFNASGRQLGELRLKTYPKDPIELDFAEQRYRIGYRVASDRFIANDFDFELIGKNGAIASAKVMAGKKNWGVRLHGIDYTLTNNSGLFSLSYVLSDTEGRALGSIAETTGFSLWRRSFRITLPDTIESASGAFLFYLAANNGYR